MPGPQTFDTPGIEPFDTLKDIPFPLLVRIGAHTNNTRISSFVQLVAILATYESFSCIFEPERRRGDFPFKYTVYAFDRYQSDRRVKIVLGLSQRVSPFKVERLVDDCQYLDHESRMRACRVFANDFLEDSSAFRE